MTNREYIILKKFLEKMIRNKKYEYKTIEIIDRSFLYIEIPKKYLTIHRILNIWFIHNGNCPLDNHMYMNISPFYKIEPWSVVIVKQNKRVSFIYKKSWKGWFIK